MTLFETLDPIASVLGWVVLSAIVLFGIALIVSIVAALLVGLIPLKSVPDHAPDGDESVGAEVVSLRSRPAPRSRVPSQPRDRGVSPQPFPRYANLYLDGPDLVVVDSAGDRYKVETWS